MCGSVAGNPKLIMIYIAELHWWQANAMFYKRGSASIAELLSITLFKKSNISFSSWTRSVDIYAFKVNISKFIRTFSVLFN